MTYEKKLIALTLILCLTLLSGVSVYALYLDESEYDKIAWTWEEYAPYDFDYNCLAYAIGDTDTWHWPSDNETCTLNEARVYLASYGYDYSYSASNPTILYYGQSTDLIDHFAKKVGTSTSRAKWGMLEVMTSYSLDPYYDNEDSYYDKLPGGFY